MKQNVLDGIVAIEAKAAKTVDDAKARAREIRQKVQGDLDTLARQLDQEAKDEAARYQRQAERRAAAALEALDRQLAEAQAALARVRTERVPPMVEELLRLLERRADGN